MRKSQAVVGFWLMHCLGREDMMREPLADLFERAARGELKPLVGDTYGLSDVRQGPRGPPVAADERQAAARPEQASH